MQLEPRLKPILSNARRATRTFGDCAVGWSGLSSWRVRGSPRAVSVRRRRLPLAAVMTGLFASFRRWSTYATV